MGLVPDVVFVKSSRDITHFVAFDELRKNPGIFYGNRVTKHKLVKLSICPWPIFVES